MDNGRLSIMHLQISFRTLQTATLSNKVDGDKKNNM